MLIANQPTLIFCKTEGYAISVSGANMPNIVHTRYAINTRPSAWMVVFLLTLQTWCGAALGQTKFDEEFEAIQHWRVEYSSANAGCIAYVSYKDDTTLMIGWNQKVKYFMMLTNPNWQSLIPNEPYNLKFVTDRKNWRGTFRAFEADGSRGFRETINEQFIQALDEAETVAVHVGNNKIFTLSMDESEKAIAALKRCTTKFWQRAKTDAGSTDRASSSRPASRSTERASGSGTGFFVAKGYIITNEHVVEKCSSIDVVRKGTPAVSAVLIGKDATNDLALIKVNISDHPVAIFRSMPKLGEAVYAFGFPFNNILASAGNFTQGNVTALSGLLNDSAGLQTSAPIQPGNSGGPLFDRFGNVVGINSMGLRGEKFQNINFAIKANAASLFLEVNNVKPNSNAKSSSMDPTEIAEFAAELSVLIQCNN